MKTRLSLKYFVNDCSLYWKISRRKLSKNCHDETGGNFSGRVNDYNGCDNESLLFKG